MFKQIETAAAALGIKAYIEAGRVKLEAKRAGDIIKAWAMAGFDVKANGGVKVKEWLVIDQSGAYVACVLDGLDGFAYSYSTK